MQFLNTSKLRKSILDLEGLHSQTHRDYCPWSSAPEDPLADLSDCSPNGLIFIVTDLGNQNKVTIINVWTFSDKLNYCTYKGPVTVHCSNKKTCDWYKPCDFCDKVGMLSAISFSSSPRHRVSSTSPGLARRVHASRTYGQDLSW